jgi:hypothetical protein
MDVQMRCRDPVSLIKAQSDRRAPGKKHERWANAKFERKHYAKMLAATKRTL